MLRSLHFLQARLVPLRFFNPLFVFLVLGLPYRGKDLDEFFWSIAGKFQTEIGKAWTSRRKNNIYPVLNFLLIFCLKNQQKMNVVKQLYILQERIDKEGADSAVQKSLLTSLKVNSQMRQATK
ncbi:uncharacterized protein LOC114392850 [Glycine soja]|uniref:uncharacterized protein LOC114392850 n=1 Tax=Glycine soja TaxID=3848 RepID=UPI00071912BB|nr:uncharacterized protein LOC114392850 [Glycine soja]XP_040867056.1 uncharacterized protein LOC121173820 [Glycine max]